MTKYMFQKFWNIYFLSVSLQGREKGNNIISFVIPYRKGKVDNDRVQGHFSGKKLFFPKKELGLTGFEHYTSKSSRYSANHYTYGYLWFV